MRSSVRVLPLLLAACGTGYAPVSGRPQFDAVAEAPPPPRDMPAPSLPPELANAQGPSGTSTAASYDRVGYATWYGDVEAGATTASGTAFDPDAIAAAHRALPLGSIAEVTALDTGKTILVRITDRGPKDPRYEIDLTRGAAALLGAQDGATPVRVRAVAASPQDAAALSRGEPASPRIDAPPALLAALRRQLPPGGPTRAPAPTKRPAPPIARPGPGAPYARPGTPAATAGSYVVQVAAFSTEGRAAALARSLGGSVQPAGALWRVRLGPFRELAAAQRARDAAARRGYADAQIIPAS